MIPIEYVTLFFAALSFILSIKAMIDVESFKKSTHRMMYYNPESSDFKNLNTGEFAPMTDEQKKKLSTPEFDNLS